MIELGLQTRMVPRRRVLDTAEPFFKDYGYQSSVRFVRSLGDSMNDSTKPHVLILVGGPDNGKEHALRDLITKLKRRKNSDFISKAVYWGNAYSVAKAKGEFPEDLHYEQFSRRSMTLVTREFEELAARAISDSDKKSLIVVKGILAAVRIDGEIHGSNCGLTAYENLINRTGFFQGLDYEIFAMGIVADPDAVQEGSKLRTKAEKKEDNPAELVKELSRGGEILLTEKGEKEELTPEQEKAIKEYILDSANEASSQQIRFFINDLAVKLSEKGMLKLNGQPYCLNGYVRDEKGHWLFPDYYTGMLADGLVMRYFLEKNLGLKYKVFLARTPKISELIFDLTSTPQNVARSYYDLEKYRNK